MSSSTTCRGFKGRHSFKAGAHFRIDHYNQVGNQFPRGGFQFDGRATGSLVGNATPIAPSFADFLLGYQRLSELSVQLAVTEFRALSQSYYLTDTWRMRDNMTLDLGLRYEVRPAVPGRRRHVDQCLHARIRPGSASCR